MSDTTTAVTPTAPSSVASENPATPIVAVPTTPASTAEPTALYDTKSDTTSDTTCDTTPDATSDNAQPDTVPPRPASNPSAPASEPQPSTGHPAGADRPHGPDEPPAAKSRPGIPYVPAKRFRARSAVLLKRVGVLLRRDDGMSTAEYAVGTVAAVAFSAALYKVVTSDVVTNGLSAIIGKALDATF
ncbi:DUF4244 domain-containing protein [Yinghuangia sp. YIM S09857]|uniref:DUF4244 domain-containing protein n=1 Tax=Yinghuangia sp. YIM S09857 TaxID=3436929 RepID=UPI003F53014C